MSMSDQDDARDPLALVPYVAGRYLSELCDSDNHARCRHPANARRTDGCECGCHGQGTS